MDVKSNFLLFCNAKGTPPSIVGRESGFDSESAISDINSYKSSLSTKRDRDTEALLEMTYSSTKKVATLVDRLGQIVEKHEKREHKESLDKLNADGIIDDLFHAQKQLISASDAQSVLSTCSKATLKKAIKLKIRLKIRRLSDQLKDAVQDK